MLQTTQTARHTSRPTHTVTTCHACGGRVRTDSLHALACPHTADHAHRAAPAVPTPSTPSIAAVLPALDARERAAIVGVWVGPLTNQRTRYSVRKAA